MKMVEFRLQNYKKVEDTGWIKCGDLMTFVGKNESGKTALFTACPSSNPPTERSTTQSKSSRMEGLQLTSSHRIGQQRLENSL